MSSYQSSVGINSQPYRTYLTERNHFYHSASQPNTFSAPITSTTITTTTSNPNTSSNGGNSSLKSSSAIQGSSLINPSQQQPKYGSRQSLNSNTSLNAKMSSHKRSSSQTLDGQLSRKNKQSSMIVDDDEDESDYDQQSACSKCMFGLLWILAQIALWGSVGLWLYWIYRYNRGLAYQNDKIRMLNLHSFLMMTGFIFVNGQSMLIYKTYLCCKRIYNKIAHALFFVLSISLVAFGMLIGIQAQHMTTGDRPPVHFYSLHSWIGLVTCGLFSLQFLFGFITFLVLLCCERVTAGYRARFLPTHVTFGIAIFLLATATCLSGLLQTARARMMGTNPADPARLDYQDMRVFNYNILENPGLVLNTVGGCLIALAILMPYLIRNFVKQH